MHVSRADQWNYIPSEQNPADVGTIGVPAKRLLDSGWFKPPVQISPSGHATEETFLMVHPDDDAEVRPVITIMKVEESSSQDPFFGKKCSISFHHGTI